MNDIEVFVVWIALSFIWPVRHLIKHNISEAFLVGDFIEIKKWGKKIKIPLTQIESIGYGKHLGSIFNGTYGTTYIVSFKKEYSFSQNIYLEFLNKDLLAPTPRIIELLQAQCSFNNKKQRTH